jgi:hypothetical protein
LNSKQDPKVDELWKKLDGQENPAKAVVAAKIPGPTLHMRVNSPGSFFFTFLISFFLK